MRNRRVSAFFNKKSYLIAAVFMVVAAFGMTGIYYTQQEKKQEEQLAKEQEEQVRQAKVEDAAREQEKKEEEARKIKEQEQAKAKEQEKKEEEETETEAVSGIIPPENDNFMDEPEVIDSEVQTPVEPVLHFDAETDLGWPLQGNVILNYSMDQTVYFATLDQYKYNPAVIIKADVNTPVKAVSGGKVTNVETNAETGATITVDMGDGYSAIYGQLKEIPKNTGDYVENGEILGYVSEPTKYYSVEGSNLYFELQKDGVPVDPMGYLQ